MADAVASPAGRALPEGLKKYALKSQLEIFPLDSSSREQKFVARLGDEKSFVISEQMNDVLRLFDGTRTVRDVAEAVSARAGAEVSEERVREAVLSLCMRYDLLEETAAGDATQPPVAPEQKKGSFEFVFRWPLISPRLARPFTDRLTWLFNPFTASAAFLLVVLTHWAFLGTWFAPLPAVRLGPTDILLCYGLAVATALVHEFGHATACRRYGCEHGAIGFLLYMVFPALFVNLSNTWRLNGKQRAVVDVGGMYFQLLTTIPLYFIYLLTGSAHCAVTIFAVDAMVLFSLNPILKFDGYWLLVDLSGLINLRSRGWKVVKELVWWALGIGKGVPVLSEVSGRGKQLLLVVYSFLSLGMFTSFVLLLVMYAPAQMGALYAVSREVFFGAGAGGTTILRALGALTMNLFFVMFTYRLLRGAASKLLDRGVWRRGP